MEQAPLNREGTPSIQEALSQAEQEHWLERPNAPLAIRLASFVLDLIFIYLFIHGQHRLLQALSIYSATSTQSTLFLLNPFFLGFVDIFVRTSFLFFYLVLTQLIFQDKQFHGLQLVIVVNRQLLQNLFNQLEYVFLLLQAFNFDVGLNRVDVVPFQEEQVTVNLFAFKYYLSFWQLWFIFKVRIFLKCFI